MINLPKYTWSCKILTKFENKKPCMKPNMVTKCKIAKHIKSNPSSISTKEKQKHKKKFKKKKFKEIIF